MTEHVMMMCGHTAQGHDKDNNPTCVICVGIDPGATIVAETPDLTGRFAKCAYKHIEEDKGVPSSLNLPFFEYLGPGSPDSVNKCVCGFMYRAHTEAVGNRRITDHEFTSHGPWEFDRYYDGCRGWD